MIRLPTDMGMADVRDGGDFYNVPELRQELTEREEIAAWGLYLQWQRKIEGKCGFSKKGIANKFERQRRWTLFAMFKMIKFRSLHPEIRSMFLCCVGKVSLQWMVECAGVNVPPFYYGWLIESHSKSLSSWGKTVFEKLGKSIEHVNYLRELRPKETGKWIVEGVMEP